MKYDIEKLINNDTGNKYIFFWGHQPEDVGILFPENWKGLNLLAFALMEARDE